MRRSLDFAFRLMDFAYPAEVSAEDFDGPHGAALRVLQSMDFLGSEPGMNPVSSCPYCFSGTPYPLGDRYLCNECHSEVEQRQLQLWRFDLEAFLRWFARVQKLSDGIEQIDDGLWRIGTLTRGDQATECFFLRGAECSALALRRLAAFRSVLILHGRSEPPRIDGIRAPTLLITEALAIDGERIIARPLTNFIGHQHAGAVRFDRKTGVLQVGDMALGRIPNGSREFAFLNVLAGALGEVVPYADLKRAVCLATGSIDSRDEATFCHRLKSRLKKDHGIPAIDRVIEADRAQGGYRLLREAAIAE